MGNIRELAQEAEAEEKRIREAKRLFYEQYVKAVTEPMLRQEMMIKRLEIISKNYRNTVTEILEKYNIPHWSTSIIVLKEDDVTHVYSRVNWFDSSSIRVRDNCRRIITEFMASIGMPLILDKDGNPENDIEWHFESRPDSNFILNALKAHGYA